MDDSLFRQKGPDQVPRGITNQAEDAVPSERSGGARIGTPVWEKFVTNTVAQKNNRAAVAAENDQIRQSRVSQPLFKGANGKLIRQVGRQREVLNAEDFVDDPEAGQEARRSLWDREIRSKKVEAQTLGDELANPALKAARMKESDYQAALAEGQFLSGTDPRHLELNARTKAHEDSQAREAELKQKHWEASTHAHQLENTDPEEWWQSRKTAEINANRQPIVQDAQAKRAVADQAAASAEEEHAEITAKLAQGVKGSEIQALQARKAEIEQGRAVIEQDEQEAAGQLEQVRQAAEVAAKPKDFFRIGDTVSGIWDAVRGLGTSAPAAFYQLVEGMERPDQYSDSAKAAFAEADAFNREMQAKTEANQKAGTSSSVGESFREAGGSLGFSLGSMAAAIPASIGGAKAGAATGAGIAAVAGFAGPQALAPEEVVTVPAGAVIGGAIGGVAAGMAASGTAAYRMAGAQFLNEAFQNLDAESMRKSGRPMNEQEKASAYEALLPIAKNTALWEAGPEAVGNAVTMGAGKIIFGLGKPLAAKFASTIGGKVIAGAGSLGVELAGETVTQVEQGADQQKAAALAQGQDPNAIKADWSAGGVTQAFKDVAPQTLALMGLMGGAGGVLKVGSKLTGIGGPGGQAVDPTADIVDGVNTGLASIDPEAEPATHEEVSRAAMLSRPMDGPAEMAENVLIERELATVEAEDDDAVRAAEENLAGAQATGDKVAIASAEANVEKARAGAGRADATRAVLKIATGQQLDDLTSAELASIGFKDSGDSFAPMTTKELKDAGITAPLIRQGADGSIIITDDALKTAAAVSPRARGRVKMSEAEAIQKAKQRASQPISTDTPDATQGDPARGSTVTGSTAGADGASPVTGISPIETKGAVEFDVPMRDGSVMRVPATTAAEAEMEAAARAEFGSTIIPGQAKAVTNPGSATKTITSTPNEQNPSQADAPVVAPKPAKRTLTEQEKRALKERVLPPPPGVDEKAWVDKQIAERITESHLTKARKNPRLAAALNVTIDPAVRAEAKPDGTIHINPDRIISEAISGGMTEDDAGKYFALVLDEEIRHAAQYDAARTLWKLSKSTDTLEFWRENHYAGIWATDFTGEKGDVVRNLYVNYDPAASEADKASAQAKWDAMSDGNKALEAIRMMSQGENVTESAKLWLGSISQSLKTALKAALASLKKFAAAASPTLQQEITNLENALRNLTDSQPRTGNPKTDPKKPTQIRPGDGNGRPAEEAGPRPTPDDGGAEQTRSDSAGSSLAVGSKVEFDRNGERLTGKVTLVMAKGSRVELDSPTSDGLPKVMVLNDEPSLKVLAAPADLKGEKIDKEWVAYSEESHSLGIPRAEMPQIHSTDRSAMVQFLKARGIDYVEEEVLPDSLKPTQLEYSPAKVQKAREHVGGNRALLISDDGHLVDGHHQWMASLDEPTTPVRVIRLMAPIREILSTVAEMPSVESDSGSNSTKNDSQPDLSDTSEGQDSDPNIGREWDSQWGRQRIIGLVNDGGTLDQADPTYEVETIGATSIRRYRAIGIEETIRKDEYRLTPEYEEEVRQGEEIRRLEKERDARASEEKRKELDSIAEFTKDMPKLYAGKVREALLKKFSFDGRVMTRKAKVEELVADGKTPRIDEEAKIKPMSRTQHFRATQREQDAHERRMKEAGTKKVYFVGDYDMGKVGYDYALFLIEQDSAKFEPDEANSSETLPVEVQAAATAPAGEPIPAAPVVKESLTTETPVEAAAEVKGEMANPQNRRPAKEIKAEIIQRVEEEIGKLPDLGTDWPTNTLPMKASLEGQHFRDLKEPEFATIKIPGDGTFRIRRTTKDLTELLSKVKRMSITDRETKPSTRFFTSTIAADTAEEALSRKDSILLGLQEPDYRKKLAKRLGEEKLTALEDMFLRQEGVTREELNGEAPAPAEDATPTVAESAKVEAKPASKPLPEGVFQDVLDSIDSEIARAEAKRDKLQTINNRLNEESRGVPGSFVTGRSNQHAGLQKRRQGLNDRMSNAFQLLQDAEKQLRELQAKRSGYASGEFHENGQPRADSPSRKASQGAVATYGDYIRATVKKGDRVTFLPNPSAGGSPVARVNQKTITLDGGTAWTFDHVMPWKNGREMTREELRADMKAWQEASAAETAEPAAKPRAIKKPKGPSRMDLLENYFTVGKLLPNGDRVLEFATGEDGRFEVKVIREGEEDARERTHSTEPHAKVLADAWKARETVPEATPAAETITNLESLLAFFQRIREGDTTAAEIKSQWEAYKAAEIEIKNEVMKMTMKELERFQGMRKPDNKADAVRMAMDALHGEFRPGAMFSYGGVIGNRDKMNQAKMEAQEKAVASWTDETIQAQAQERRDAKAAREKALNNPETLDEWKQFVRRKGLTGMTAEEVKVFNAIRSPYDLEPKIMARGESRLTPEQLAAYDEVRGIDRKAEAQARKERETTVRGVKADTGSEIVETKHTKTGADLFVVRLADRVEREVYNSLNAAAKKLGGYYSSYRGGGAVPGFQFKDRATAEQFQSVTKGETVDRSEAVQERQSERRSAAAEKLSALADRMDETADKILGADRKTNTAKRAREAGYAESNANSMKAMATTMRNLADAIESGEATHLDGVRTRTHVETLMNLSNRAKLDAENAENLSYSDRENRKGENPTADQISKAKYPWPFLNETAWNWLIENGKNSPGAVRDAKRMEAHFSGKATGSKNGSYLTGPDIIATVKGILSKISAQDYTRKNIEGAFESYDRVQAMGLTDLPSLRAALREFLQYRGTKAKADPVKAMERDLVGIKIEGFFPTPPVVIERMIEEAGDLEGKRVLEPSAGKGDIVEAAQRAGADVDAIEHHYTLRNILEAKGASLTGRDFMDVEPSPEYDAVLMNPPFENGQDGEHVQRAYQFLKPGGKLVAITGEGIFVRSDKKSQAFRDWLDSVGGTSEKLPESSFKSAFRPTGVATRIVVIDGPAESGLRAAELPSAQTLRERLNSAFNLPPASYEFDPSNENRSKILDVCTKHGLRPVSPKDHGASTRRVQEISGAVPVYFKGGDPSDTGFASGNLIFINAERDDIPTGWTIAHELVHVAQKDKSADAKAVNQLFKTHLSPVEIARAEEYLLDGGKYSEESLQTELPAFLVADAVMDTEVIGFSSFKNGDALKKALVEWFDQMPSLEPEILRESDDGLLASPLPESTGDTFKKRVPVSKPLINEARRQQEAFGKNVSSGKLASFGDEKGRKDQDVVDAFYEFQKAVKSNADAMKVARERLAADPAFIEEKLKKAALGEDVSLDAADELAFQLLINQRTADAGNDTAKLEEVYSMRMAYRLERGDTARRLQVGYDRNLSPAERALAAIADAIYTPTKRVEKYAKKLHGAKRQEFLDQAGKDRIAAVQKELAKANLTIADITGKNTKLQLANSELMKQVLKLKKALDQDIIKMVQAGATISDIKRRYGKDAAEQAQAVADAARADLFAKIKALAASGMSRADILQQGLKAAPLGGSANAMTDEEIMRMIEVDFGIPKVIPLTSLPKARAPKAPTIVTNPFTADWSRPEFTDGMNSYQFDTKDRAGIMNRVEIIRGLAGAMGKIDALTGDNQEKAKAALKEIDQILSKYGTDAKGIFSASKGIEDYGFDINDINQVAAVSRIISMLDADWIDKASEVLYANMLSGLQTMAVNATAIIPAAWESTVGRGVEMAINSAIGGVGKVIGKDLKDPMSAQWGEEKYILKALGPAITRAMSNFSASMQAQHPMFDRDVLNHEVDWEKILGGAGYRVGGSISGKKGDIIRIPMRLLSATDDFNRTLMACVEVGTFAYRMAKAQDLKPGTPEFDKFIRVQVNTPGSQAYVLAAEKASRAIFSNPLPGQMDPTTGKVVEVHDLGDMVGWAAASLTKFSAKEHDNMFVKASQAALRIAFFPFQRTPFNILRQGVRYTLNPFSLFDIGLGVVQNSMDTNSDGSIKWKWNAKGRNPELVSRMGKQLQGAMLMLLLAAVGAGEGDDDDQEKPFVITGSAPFSPQGRAEREAQLRSGIGPYRISFRRRDGSERFGFNYGRLEPLATTLAASIDLMKSVKRASRSGKDNYDSAAEALGGLAAQAQDKSFLKGLSDLVALVTNLTAQPELQENRKFQQFLAGRVAMVIPNIIKQPIREADSVYRERSNSFMQEMLYQVFPAGQKEAKVDPYGRQATKAVLTGSPHADAAIRAIDVTDAGTNEVHPVDRMLLRFRDKHPGDAWFPSPIYNAEFKHPKTGQSMKMNEAQLAEFRQKSGQLLTMTLKAQGLNFDNPSVLDIEKVKTSVSKARSVAKKALAFKFAKELDKTSR